MNNRFLICTMAILISIMPNLASAQTQYENVLCRATLAGLFYTITDKDATRYNGCPYVVYYYSFPYGYKAYFLKQQYFDIRSGNLCNYSDQLPPEEHIACFGSY